MPVVLVLSETRTELTPERHRKYDRLRARLAAASGEPIEVEQYEQVDPIRLARASAIVLSGSFAPWAAHDEDALARLGEAVRSSGRPVLGICAGLQLQTMFAGGEVGHADEPERGFVRIDVHDRSDLFRGLPDDVVVFQAHGDEVKAVPPDFRILASSSRCAVQAIASPARRWWGTQFHPEDFSPEHPSGERILRTFFELAREAGSALKSESRVL